MKKSWWKRRIIWVPLFLIAATSLIGITLIKYLLGDLGVFLPYGKELLGFNDSKKYLILLQNNNEIRPNGGFISAYGILDVNKGHIQIKFDNSINLPGNRNLPTAPLPFDVLLKDDPNFKGWYFRDANFNPDFSKSAQDIERLYWQQSGETGSFDGIIAVNFEFLEDLSQIYDLQVDNLKLTRQNLFSTIEFSTKNIDLHNVEDLKNRKNILGKIADVLIKQAATSPSKYKTLFNTITTGLNEKKLQLYFKDPELQQIADQKGWTRTFNPNPGSNFIYTNIANIGGRKSDRYLKKTHEYTLSFDENGRAKVKYTLSLEHFGDHNLNSDTYKGYLRIFLPQNIEFLKSTGDFFEDRHDMTKDGYFEGYITLDPGQKKDFTIEYLLPKNPARNYFDLKLIKQPGTMDIWNINLQLSPTELLDATDFETRDNLGFWSGYLTQDKNFKFAKIKDTIPPLVVWQKFIETNLIELNFSESLNNSMALNRDNYEITDLNYIDKTTDTITTKNAYFKNGNYYLETSGITPALEERYSLTLKNLEDKAGNKTSPSPLKITIVQRFDK